MKTSMKKDLLQGLLAYPEPVYGSRSYTHSEKANPKFYQTINQIKPTNRLRRQRLSVSPDNSWNDLRHKPKY